MIRSLNSLPILSFCIPTYSRAEKVLKLVYEILRYEGFDIEVVVSDNCSDDGTRNISLDFINKYGKKTGISEMIETNLAKKTKFFGFVNNIYDLYPKIKILASTSKMESFPRGVSEAMSFGIPVVATNVGGLSEIINNEKNGFLVHFNDIEAMVDTLKILLIESNKYDKIAHEAFYTIKNKFSEENMINKNYQLILSL